METAEKSPYELFKNYKQLIVDVLAIDPNLAVEYVGDEQPEEYWYHIAIARDFEISPSMLEVFDDEISYDTKEMERYCQAAPGNTAHLDQILLLTHDYVFETTYTTEVAS